MKKIFLLTAFLATCLIAQAQTFSTSLSSQRWAGGICCHSGTNYVLTIKGNAPALEKLVVKAVCIDGLYFDQVIPSAVVSTSQYAYRTFSFSVTSSYRPGVPDQTNTQATCNEKGKIYLAGKEFLLVEARTELPYIPYP